MRIVKVEDVPKNFDEIKLKALNLVLGDSNLILNPDVLGSSNIEEIENNIKKLNSYSNRCWLLSALLLYNLVYDEELYKQTGLTWQGYIRDAKKRLNLDRREISQALSSARFFIKHHNELIKKGWNPDKATRKLSKCELALELSGDLDAVIDHLINDTTLEFQNWYSNFKIITPNNPSLPMPSSRDDIEINDKSIKINGVSAFSISDNISNEDKTLIENCFVQIFQAIKNGYTPQIITTKNKE